MNRRNFLGKIGIGAAACAVTPFALVDSNTVTATYLTPSEILTIYRNTGILFFQSPHIPICKDELLTSYRLDEMGQTASGDVKERWNKNKKTITTLSKLTART